MPEIFHLDHPIGSVVGQAKMENYLIIYQGVNIGGNLNFDYPSFDEGVVLFPRASVLGSCYISSNCAIGTHVLLYNEDIKKNSSVSMRNREGVKFNQIKWSVKERYFPKS